MVEYKKKLTDKDYQNKALLQLTSTGKLKLEETAIYIIRVSVVFNYLQGLKNIFCCF